MSSLVSASHAGAAAARVRVICLLGLMTLSSTVCSFTPTSSPTGNRIASDIAVSLYIDPADTATPRASPSASRSSPKSDGTTGINSDESSAAVAKPSRRRRRQEPQNDHISIASTPEEFDAVVRSEDEKLVVVRFHSPYCPACKSISISYDRLAKSNTPAIKFVDVSVTDRNDLIPYGLDVPATPFGQIWHPVAGLVEESAIPRRQFSKFKKILKWYAKGECELPEEFFTNPHNEYELENLIL
mmetsp:Transcript_25112/g.54391  ORF Transcript_25112/g.54391 Transcript_25112/m.54391 type:complete len:243 (+) Transcript_25112:194-922(+)